MNKGAFIFGILLLLACGHLAVQAQTTTWTYQGSLTEQGQGVTGLYDMTFTLFTSETEGTPVATVSSGQVSVSNGVFVVQLEFGSLVFDGTDYWLEIAVQSTGGSEFTTLSPRQPLSPVPYAITAFNLQGALPSVALAGIYDEPVTLSNPSNVLVGDGSGLLHVTAVGLDEMASSKFWQVGGNVVDTGSAFLGTQNDSVLQLGVNGDPILIIQPSTNTNGTPNIVAGAGSTIASAASGGTIGGGFGNTLEYDADNATISDGAHNTIDSPNVQGSTIGGGVENVIGAGPHATISGGIRNSIGGFFGMASFIGGGEGNRYVGSSSSHSTIVGGLDNSIISDNAKSSTIGGGTFNVLGGSLLAQENVIAGGSSNRITGSITVGGVISGGRGNIVRLGPTESTSHSTIAGGQNNEVAGSAYATISGGSWNNVGSMSNGGAVGGGSSNMLSGLYTTIAGGANNVASNQYSVVAGGLANTAGGDYASVGGGHSNFVDSINATIGGGLGNEIVGDSGETIAGGSFNSVGYSPNAVISGGMGNRIRPPTFACVIGGGVSNRTSSASFITIAGGSLNGSVDAHAGTISGGIQNDIDSSSFGTIAGGNSNSIAISDSRAPDIPRPLSVICLGFGRFVAWRGADPKLSAFLDRGISLPGTSLGSRGGVSHGSARRQDVFVVRLFAKEGIIPLRELRG